MDVSEKQISDIVEEIEEKVINSTASKQDITVIDEKVNTIISQLDAKKYFKRLA